MYYWNIKQHNELLKRNEYYIAFLKDVLKATLLKESVYICVMMLYIPNFLK